MGAAKAVLVSDDALAGSDALDTAKVLAAAIKRVEDADLVLTATESSDGYTGTVPEQIAELLGLPSITFAKHVEIADGTVKVQRQTEAGYDEVECPLPAVVVGDRRRGRAPLPVLQGDHGGQVEAGRRGRRSADLGIDASQVGWAGAGQEIVERRRRPPSARGRRDHRGRRRGLREDRRRSSSSSRSSERAPTRRTHGTDSASGCTPKPPTARSPPSPSSCSPRPAALGGTVEAFYGGADADAIAAALGAHGATKVARDRRPRRCAARRRPWPRPSPAMVEAGDGPT